MKLSASFQGKFGESEPLIRRIRDGFDQNTPLGAEEILIFNNSEEVPADLKGFFLIRFSDDVPNRGILITRELSYLSQGDIIRINPHSNEIRVLYRKNSSHNVLFFTERCNSRCVMCSQPPRDVDDEWLIDDILKTLPLMDIQTGELCITGGEPTLLFDRFVEVVQAVKLHLPDTALHVLSNGRLFSYLKLAQQTAEINHPDFMIGVPLYSDVPSLHDYVVQATGAFDQTILGMMNLARVGIRVEIRIVVHNHTYKRLPQLAEFITRNLPFASHVTFMGLEPMGFGKANFNTLWVDPVDYQKELSEAVLILDRRRIRVSVYNHQLCTLTKSLHPFARKSISDWKNSYLSECSSCDLREACGGFFEWALPSDKHSKGIKPFSSLQFIGGS